MNKKGFTLIELLVVIAIIGILAGAIVISMSGAQSSAKDARIRSSMDQLRSVVELYMISQSPMTYEDFDTESPEAVSLIKDIESQLPDGETFKKNDKKSAYCMSVKLNDGNHLCMDSTGAVKNSECDPVATDAVCL
ncbi:MAG: type II secretion system protein [Parcubacteria group bacterium]|nr:type II secretion system protein [Parcubacteria group bacterium]